MDDSKEKEVVLVQFLQHPSYTHAGRLRLVIQSGRL